MSPTETWPRWSSYHQLMELHRPENIEDDVAVTATGHEVLTAAALKEPQEMER